MGQQVVDNGLGLAKTPCAIPKDCQKPQRNDTPVQLYFIPKAEICEVSCIHNKQGFDMGSRLTK